MWVEVVSHVVVVDTGFVERELVNPEFDRFVVVNVVNESLFRLTVSEDPVTSLRSFSGIPRRFEEDDVVSTL